MTTALGAGPHIRKRIPSKRIKAAHRRERKAGSLLSLRKFARLVAGAFAGASAGSENKLAAQKWLAAKELR